MKLTFLNRFIIVIINSGGAVVIIVIVNRAGSCGAVGGAFVTIVIIVSGGAVVSGEAVAVNVAFYRADQCKEDCAAGFGWRFSEKSV